MIAIPPIRIDVSHARRRRRAFTLIELMVTIGIIVVLVAITTAVTVIVLESSERRQTEATLTLLQSATESWEIGNDRTVTFGSDVGYSGGSIYYDLDADDADLIPGGVLTNQVVGELGTRYLSVLQRSKDAEETLANINPSQLKQVNPGGNPPDLRLRLLDAWDTPILILFAGRRMDPVLYAGDDFDDADEDGSIRTVYENFVGVAAQRVTAFVSAGPDGRFGNRDADVDSAAYQQTLDNVYSYELGTP